MSKNDNRQLLSRALFEAFESKYSAALAESADISIRKVRDCREEQARRRKRPFVAVAAMFVAAAVMCGCSWSSRRERMGDYLIEYTAEAVRVFTARKVKYDLSEYRSYQLGYVPDGYELIYEAEDPGSTNYSWENSEGDEIHFKQTVHSQLGDFDNKGDEKYFIDHNGTEILYVEVSEKYNAYIYRRGMYHVIIKSNERFSDEVIGQMIDSVTEK